MTEPTLNTDCSKCGAPMVKLEAVRAGMFASFLLTAYACQHCGHHNDLKRRKGWKEAHPTPSKTRPTYT